MRNIAIIPARSGSKGLKDKNIKSLHGKPLIAYTIIAAQQSKLFDEIVVSTDSEEYAEIAREWGASVPFLRSEKVSSDTASSWDVVREVLHRFSENEVSFDEVALLQPTSPLRDAEDILSAFSLMKQKEADSIISVCEVNHSPILSNVLPSDQSLYEFLKEEVTSARRQDLPTYYRINGAMYIVKAECLECEKFLYGENSYAYIMEKEKSIDIDDAFDFRCAEILLENGNDKNALKT